MFKILPRTAVTCHKRPCVERRGPIGSDRETESDRVGRGTGVQSGPTGNRSPVGSERNADIERTEPTAPFATQAIRENARLPLVFSM